MRLSCNGCRVLRKGCSDSCSIRPCLQWIKSPDAQSNATVFLAKFYGRAGLLNLINAGGPEHLRPAVFRSLLYEACGRIVNPIYGSVGLLWSGNWHMCQAAVEAVLKGAPIVQISDDEAAASAAAAHPFLLHKAYDIRHVVSGGGSNNNDNNKKRKLLSPSSSSRRPAAAAASACTCNNKKTKHQQDSAASDHHQQHDNDQEQEASAVSDHHHHDDDHMVVDSDDAEADSHVSQAEHNQRQQVEDEQQQQQSAHNDKREAAEEEQQLDLDLTLRLAPTTFAAGIERWTTS